MAEAAFKQMIATFIRQTRPQNFRHGKPPRYPQRSLATAATVRPDHLDGESRSEWQAHPLAPIDTPSNPVSKPRLEKLRTEIEPKPFSSFLTDNYAREHNYLRISLTERCNLRCLYCMPEEGIQLSPPDHILTTPEIVYLSSLFVDQGVNKIRLTGGEPTVRKDILELMRQIGQLRSNGLKELCITTNGISLHRKLDSMLESGLTGVNLSLDTLDPFQFTIMTRRNGHEAVMKSINRILEMNKAGAGIKLKINCVVMRGLNDREIIPFVELGREKDLEVRFIEYMPFDGNKWSQNKMLSFQEMLATIRQKYPDVHKVKDHANDTSKTYKIPGFAGRIGFITSMTHNFCGTCNRLRITSDGNLKVCLFGNTEVSLRDILRESNDGRPIDAEAMDAIKHLEKTSTEASSTGMEAHRLTEREARLLDVIGMAVKRKKEKHADDILYAHTNQYAHRVQSPLRVSSPLLAVRSSTAFSKSIPTYLFPHSSLPSLAQQHRYRSTFLLKRTYITKKSLYRHVWSYPVYRKALFDPLKHTNSRENLERSARTKQLLYEAAGRIARRAGLSYTRIFNRNSDEFKSMDTPRLTHLNSSGEAHMVNIGHKRETYRSATAISHLLFSQPTTYHALIDASLEKGDALAIARIAGIQGAKRTADLIPLAHPSLSITAVSVDLDPFAPTSNYVKRKLSKPDTKEDDASPSTSEPTADNNSSPHKPPTMKSEYGGVRVLATVECYGKTGIEMEALTAANVAVLTLYDMLKAIDKTMQITNSRVIEKRGGKSGSWRWNKDTKRLESFSDNINLTSAEQPPPQEPHEVINEIDIQQESPSISISTSPNPNTAVDSPSTIHEPNPPSPNPDFPLLSTFPSSLSPQEHQQNHHNHLNPPSTNSTLTPTTQTSNNHTNDNNDNDPQSAQAIFEEEWNSLTDAFSTSSSLPTDQDQDQIHTFTPFVSETTTNTTTTNEEEEGEGEGGEGEEGEEEGHKTSYYPKATRDMFSGDSYGRCDAAGFRKAREERYEAWTKKY